MEARGWTLDDDAMDSATCGSSTQLLQWLTDRGQTVSSYMLYEAVGRNDVDMVDWLVDRGCRPYAALLYRAAHFSPPSLTKHLLSLDCPYDEVELTTAACGSGYGLELFEWLTVERGMATDADACIRAVLRRGTFDTAPLYATFGRPLDAVYVRHAAERDRIDWLRLGLATDPSLSHGDIRFLIKGCSRAVRNEVIRSSAVARSLWESSPRR
jgi:hypothetical protein